MAVKRQLNGMLTNRRLGAVAATERTQPRARGAPLPALGDTQAGQRR
jgi:hypothetical protein